MFREIINVPLCIEGIKIQKYLKIMYLYVRLLTTVVQQMKIMTRVSIGGAGRRGTAVYRNPRKLRWRRLATRY